MDDLAAELAGQPPPACRRNPRADDRDMLVFTVQERRGQQPLFQGIGEFEPAVDARRQESAAAER